MTEIQISITLSALTAFLTGIAFVATQPNDEHLTSTAIIAVLLGLLVGAITKFAVDFYFTA